MTLFTEHKAFPLLQSHAVAIANERMQDWFINDPERYTKFSLQTDEILLDYSKNRITHETLDLLCDLAQQSQLAQKIEALFSGECINQTEQRPALHTALRDHSSSSLWVNGKNILPDIQDSLLKMQNFTHQVHTHEWRGATGKPITDIVNIGIGGSHLGPMMTVNALSEFSETHLRCHFIANIDVLAIKAVLKKVSPESTLFIISSKSFTTLETMTNARKIREWLQQELKCSVEKHFVAITATPQKAIEFGIPEQQIFTLWDWVGGRYSIWSTIGLPLMLMIGSKQFQQFLAGAHSMDQHFKHAPFNKNMPVILGMLGIWYINFFHASQHAIVPYTHALQFLPEYLQQLDMESNGKYIHLKHHPIDYATGPVIFGTHGCEGQHSFFQLLHQGQRFIPVDFIITGEHKQELLIASALTQAQALMQGKTVDQARAELQALGLTQDEANYLAIHKSIPGNRPSNILFLDKISPYNLGALLALYEHKIFVQSVIWGINSFDQWGVELGKQLLSLVMNNNQLDETKSDCDGSTAGLIRHYKKMAEELP